MSEYKLPCPICGKIREFASKTYFYKARKHNKPCMSCSNSIKAGGKGNLYHGDSKTCPICNIIKPLSEFFSYKIGSHHSCCKNCSKSKSHIYHKNTYRYAKYGITKEQFDELFKNQEGKCPICKTELKKEIHIDHDHLTGQVRGVLCGKCNKGLGQFNDNIESLTNAIKYLSR
jgi:hypothetical protein